MVATTSLTVTFNSVIRSPVRPSTRSPLRAPSPIRTPSTPRVSCRRSWRRPSRFWCCSFGVKRAIASLRSSLIHLPRTFFPKAERVGSIASPPLARDMSPRPLLWLHRRLQNRGEQRLQRGLRLVGRSGEVEVGVVPSLFLLASRVHSHIRELLQDVLSLRVVREAALGKRVAG
jgi:hypothetical protein